MPAIPQHAINQLRPQRAALRASRVQHRNQVVHLCIHGVAPLFVATLPAPDLLAPDPFFATFGVPALCSFACCSFANSALCSAANRANTFAFAALIPDPGFAFPATGFATTFFAATVFGAAEAFGAAGFGVAAFAAVPFNITGFGAAGFGI